MPTASVTLSARFAATGLAGTLGYKVVGPLGTHAARTTAGITADATDGRWYQVTRSIDTAWVGAEVVWDDGTSEAREGLAGHQVAIEAAASRAVLDEVNAKLDGASITRASPVDPLTNALSLIQGDDYTNGALGDLRLSYVVTGFGGSVVGATVEWRLMPLAAYERDPAGVAELVITTGATVALNGSTLTFRVPITRTQTAALAHTSPPEPSPNYRVMLRLIGSGGEKLTELLADATVVRNIG